MKKLISAAILTTLILAYTGCLEKAGRNKGSAGADTVTVADTGYTGIKQYYSKSNLTYEVTFKNGVRHGLMKTYYADGKLRQTFWYENGMREDTAIWFYEDGKVFRKTPYKRDSMNGIQTQYYKSGKVKARLEYVDGLRKPYLEEFTMDGKKVTDYPVVVVKTTDNYNSNGTYTITLELNKKGAKARFYRGDFIDGLFVPKKLTNVNYKTPDGKIDESGGKILLRKSATANPGYIDVISEVLTGMQNRLIVYNKIEIPYKDLN